MRVTCAWADSVSGAMRCTDGGVLHLGTGLPCVEIVDRLGGGGGGRVIGDVEAMCL